MLKIHKKTKLFTAIFCLSCSVSLAAPAQEDKAAALHLDWLDSRVAPGKDFYAYANGTWQKKNPVPPEYSSWGSFNILHEKMQVLLNRMLSQAAKDKNAKPGSIEQKVGDFYFSGMNEAEINKQGLSPLQPEIARINAIKTLDDLQNVLTHLQQIGVNVLFGFGSMQDFKNSKEMIAAAFQGGLGLPDRDYYLKEDKKFQDVRTAYLQHLTKMFELSGDDPALAAKEAKTVMAIETGLAKASLSQIEQRDPYAIYHMKDLAELNKITPNFSWPRYFTAIGQPQIKYINLAMPGFFKHMNTELGKVALDDWKIYLRWHLLKTFAPYLSKAFVDQDFQMHSVLTGTKKLLPRWHRVVNAENSALGFAVGKLYVERHFSPADKEAVLKILANIRKVLKADLKTLAWMTPATRQAALKKLALIEERVGYPDKWWDYSSLKIDRGPYVENVKRANAFIIKRDLNKIGKPVDRNEWSMTPQTVNAYYDASMNNINMPAGILQPPFYDSKAPAAVNYGAIGYVMGHEITHGFDDQGAKFDGEGNLKNWWTAEDLKKFRAATDCIVAQFSKYKVNGDLPVQGKLVVGEATADLGGLILAYKAYHTSDEYKKAKIVSGFTPDQQFFLGSAHIWTGNVRPEQLRHWVTTDPHPPMQYRVNGTLANMPQFKAAFSIKDDSIMVNSKRCVIW